MRASLPHVDRKVAEGEPSHRLCQLLQAAHHTAFHIKPDDQPGDQHGDGGRGQQREEARRDCTVGLSRGGEREAPCIAHHRLCNIGEFAG